jgi:flagellar motor component MotA
MLLGARLRCCKHCKKHSNAIISKIQRTLVDFIQDGIRMVIAGGAKHKMLSGGDV